MLLQQPELGRRIREEREAKGWTQQQLANAAGLTSSNYLSKVERSEGGKSLTRDKVRLIAEALGLRADAFEVGGEPSSSAQALSVAREIITAVETGEFEGLGNDPVPWLDKVVWAYGEVAEQAREQRWPLTFAAEVLRHLDIWKEDSLRLMRSLPHEAGKSRGASKSATKPRQG